jgi:transposase
LKNELLKFSKEELADFIIKLSDRLEKVEARLRQYESPNTPSSRRMHRPDTSANSAADLSDKQRFPGREKNHEGTGIHIPKPDEIKEYKLNRKRYVCIGTQTYYTIDFVDMPILVTKHIVYSYRKPNGDVIEANHDFSDKIYGKNLQVFMTLLRSKGVSHASISEVIKNFRSDLTICEATVSSLTDGISKKAEQMRLRMIQRLRDEPYSQQDETGLRLDGKNGYAWVFCSKKYTMYEIDRSRSKEVPQRILGADYDKPAVNDGWGAYNFFKKRQRCWPHLLRELDALALEHPEAIPQAMHLHALYKKALEAKKFPKRKRMELIEHCNSMTELPHMIHVLSTTAGCKEFATTLKNALPNLFVGVEFPEVPLDNNLSERELKPIIKLRKNIGCIRNEKGARFVENTMSLIQTWKRQNKDVYKNLKNYAS